MNIGTSNTTQKVFIVAEIGNNHEGNVNIAIEMIDAAKECGVDAVKFQTFQTKYYVSRQNKARFERLKSFELSRKEFSKLAEYARKRNRCFLSTPFDLESAKVLLEIADAVKISSSDNNFYPLLDIAAKGERPLLVSTGLSPLGQIKKTIQFVKERRDVTLPGLEVALLHCVTSYPVKDEEANLCAITQLRKEFNDMEIGYSDHTLGSEAVIVAVALGARIIEKHFTLDKNQSDFRDHKLSADPAEMKKLVSGIRRAEKMMRDSGRKVQKSEKELREELRRSIAAGKALKEGHILKKKDLTWVRPGTGLQAGEEECLIGKKLKIAKSLGDLIKIGDVADE